MARSDFGERGIRRRYSGSTGGGPAPWNPAGIAVCDAPAHPVSVRMLADGAGGVFLAWEDRRKGLDSGAPHHHPLYNPYAQRLDASGAVVAWADGADLLNVQRSDAAGWPDGGLELTPLQGFQIYRA